MLKTHPKSDANTFIQTARRTGRLEVLAKWWQ